MRPARLPLPTWAEVALPPLDNIALAFLVVVVIVALISPFRADRDFARTTLGSLFKEVYLSTPLSECERRDPKGLYKKTRAGLISDMTGIDSPYEVPLQPEIILDTSVLNIKESVEKILSTI